MSTYSITTPRTDLTVDVESRTGQFTVDVKNEQPARDRVVLEIEPVGSEAGDGSVLVYPSIGRCADGLPCRLLGVQDHAPCLVEQRRRDVGRGQARLDSHSVGQWGWRNRRRPGWVDDRRSGKVGWRAGDRSWMLSQTHSLRDITVEPGPNDGWTRGMTELFLVPLGATASMGRVIRPSTPFRAASTSLT